MKGQNNYNFYYDNDIPIKKNISFNDLAKRNNNIPNNQGNKDKNSKIKKIILGFCFVVFFVIFSVCSFEILKWYKDSNNTKKTVEELNNMAEVIEVATEDETDTSELINEPDKVESDYWYYVKFPLIQVDFDELIKKNNDTVAWIQVNNTNINYPIVQASDNDYYLNRSYDKKYNEAGWVFMDYRNDSNLNDKNTIIYAHSRLDKTMFGSLSKVLKNDWYKNKDNHIIKMSTPYENSLWQIFSVYKIEAESYYITTEFDSDDEYLKFLNTIKKRSKYGFDVSLSKDDSIITLSTCYSETERTVVHAKKIKKTVRAS